MSFKVKDVPTDAISTNQIDGLYKYIASIDYEETWIQGYIVAQASLFLLIIATRKFTNFQGVLFVSLLFAVYNAEWMNEELSKNYKLFSKHQYFDSQGMFISLIFSLPALINCVVILINWLLVSGNMLVSVKRKQIDNENKKRSKEAEENKKSKWFRC